MTYEITNKLTGEMHPTIFANPVSKKVLLWDNRSGLDPSKLWKDGFARVGNGYSAQPYLGKWRLFSPGDNCHEYVQAHPDAHLIDWNELFQAIESAPLPKVDQKQQQEDLARGLKSWKRSWNQFEGAGTGQAYMDC